MIVNLTSGGVLRSQILEHIVRGDLDVVILWLGIVVHMLWKQDEHTWGEVKEDKYCAQGLTVFTSKKYNTVTQELSGSRTQYRRLAIWHFAEVKPL
jgi:hypothetical protein